jgi:hypothetical protein
MLDMTTLLYQYPYKKINTLCIAALIYISASPLFENVEKLIFTFTFLLLLKYFSKIKLKIYDSLILLILTFLILLYGFILDIIYSKDIDLINFGFIISIFFGYLLSCLETKEHFFYANEKLVHWTLLIGLPIFLLISLFPFISNFALTYNYGGYFHKTFIVTNIHYAEEGQLSDRFVGFGREPGVTQFFYILALWSRLKRNRKFTLPVILIILAVILGKSTAGFFTMILVIFLTIPIKNNIKYILISSPLIIFFLIDQFNYHWQNKLSGSDSFVYRYERYYNFFNSDFTNIMFGYGNAFYKKSIGVTDLGGWDTFLQLSQRYGVISFILISIILFLNNKKYAIVSLIIFITFFSQLIWFYPAIAFFYFKGMSNTLKLNNPI